MCVVINIDESEVGGRGLSQNMDKTTTTGYTTGTYQHPRIPEATFTGNHTSLLTGVAVEIEDDQATELKPGMVVPSLYVFSGKESVPCPQSDSDFVDKSFVACTESGAVTNELFEKMLEHVLLPDIIASYPQLKKDEFEILLTFDRPRTHTISADLVQKFIDAGVILTLLTIHNPLIIDILLMNSLFPLTFC